MLPRHPVYHALLWRWGISVSQWQLLNAALSKVSKVREAKLLNKHCANLSKETTEALLFVDINYRKVFQPERVQQAASINKEGIKKSQKTLVNIFMRIKPNPTESLIIKLMHLIWIVNTVFFVVVQGIQGVIRRLATWGVEKQQQ